MKNFVDKSFDDINDTIIFVKDLFIQTVSKLKSDTNLINKSVDLDDKYINNCEFHLFKTGRLISFEVFYKNTYLFSVYLEYSSNNKIKINDIVSNKEEWSYE